MTINREIIPEPRVFPYTSSTLVFSGTVLYLPENVMSVAVSN